MPIRFVAVERTPPRRSWLALSIIQHGAATFPKTFFSTPWRQSAAGNIIFVRGIIAGTLVGPPPKPVNPYFCCFLKIQVWPRKRAGLTATLATVLLLRHGNPVLSRPTSAVPTGPSPLALLWYLSPSGHPDSGSSTTNLLRRCSVSLAPPAELRLPVAVPFPLRPRTAPR